MRTPREYLEEIRKRQINSDKEFMLDSLRRAIDTLQKAFPRCGSFLMEFVQNADDAESRSLKIELLQGAVRISNDGLPFSEEDVKSICKVGRSSKTAKDYIGYLGVGFKAVFLISECAEIYSGGYRFKFDKAVWQDSEHIPWQVIPVWIDNPNVDLSKYKTVFNLPLKVSELIEKLREEIKLEHLSNRMLLFLRNIKKIEIIDVAQNLKREIVKSEFSKTSNYEIYQIQEYENDIVKNEDFWLIFRSISDVPPDVKKDYVTKEWEREKVKKREVLTAFKLNEENNILKEEKGTAHAGVFSFLPLKEIPSGLSFLLQADFLTTPGRSEFARECLWNDWLSDEICDLIVKKCIPAFLNHEKWKMNFTDILYSPEGGHELFEEHIKKPLNKYIENNAVLIAKDDTPSKVKGLILVEEEIRKLLMEEGLKFIYQDKKVIHKECKPHPSLKIKNAPKDIYKFIDSSESDELIKLKAKKKEIKWFKKLYGMIVDKYDHEYFRNRYLYYNVEHDSFWDRMHDFYKPIILTADGDLAKVNVSYTNPKKLKIPEEIKDKFKIVHPEILKDEKFGEFIKKLNEERYHHDPPSLKVIGELIEDDIGNALRKQEAIELTEEKWRELTDHKKIEKIKHLKELWMSYLYLKDYNFLTLKSKTGEWVKPEDLVFSKEYKPEHNIEILSEEKKLLDLPLKFVSPEFIEKDDDDEIRKWRGFFAELGVDKIVESARNAGGRKGGIVHRVAVLTALRFEKDEKNKRTPRELGESENPGYDIESKSENEERYIEVKGASSPSLDIFLTVNEFRALRNKQNRYFIYVVVNALRNPILYVTQGNKLLDIADTADINIIIPFAAWRDRAKEEEFQP